MLLSRLRPARAPRARRHARGCAHNPLGLPEAVFAKTSAVPLPPGDVGGTVDFFYSDWVDMQLPARHRFPMEKYTLARELLESEGQARLLPGPLATLEEACLAHDRGYVESIIAGQTSVAMRKRVGFAEAPMEAYVLRSLASLGATVAATRRCLLAGGAWSGALSGGTHHAFAAAGEGFCVFNDVAVAARLAQAEFGVESVLIVDLDVHQGNGTAKIFEGDDSVFTYSAHQEKGYPFSTRCASDMDVGLPDGCSDERFMELLEPLRELIAARRPGLLIYQSGVDGLRGDRFGRLALTRGGLRWRNSLVYAAAAELGVPVVVTMGGGYHKDISQTVECSADVYRQAVDWSRGRHASAAAEAVGAAGAKEAVGLAGGERGSGLRAAASPASAGQ